MGFKSRHQTYSALKEEAAMPNNLHISSSTLPVICHIKMFLLALFSKFSAYTINWFN